MDPQGKVSGLLDIAKCLYDAVHRLEKAAKKKAEEEEEEGGGDSGGGGNVAMLGAVMEAAKAIKGKSNARNQKALQVSCAGEERMLRMIGRGEGRGGVEDDTMRRRGRGRIAKVTRYLLTLTGVVLSDVCISIIAAGDEGRY